MLKYQSKSNARFLIVEDIYSRLLVNSDLHIAQKLSDFDDIEVGDFDETYFSSLKEDWEKNHNKFSEIIDEYSPKRLYSDINALEKSILHLGLTEKIRGEIDDKIIIDECIEICKTMGGDHKFVNGILDNIFKNFKQT